MQFTLDMGDGANQIRGYDSDSGQIKINEIIYSKSIIVSPTLIIDDWKPQKISELTTTDIEVITALSPQVVLIGTGKNPRQLDPQLLQLFWQSHIGIEVMTTAAACRTYDVLMAEGRNVVAALFL